MLPAIKVARQDVAAIVAATFPSYKGRKFRIAAKDAVSLQDLNWSGGTRSQYRGCTLDGKSSGAADGYNARAPWDNPAEGATIPIPVGFALVEHVIFCGKDLGLRIYVNPADMPKLLPNAET